MYVQDTKYEGANALFTKLLRMKNYATGPVVDAVERSSL
jgi:hypothetical protein